MRKLFTLIIAASCFSITKAQENTLIIEGVKSAFYLDHKVAPKENLYSIGRLFNISPKEIAPFNNIEITKGLSLGQDLHIPLTNSNFIQTTSATVANEALIPIYHVVAAKETLSKIAAEYAISADDLKNWNKLKTPTLSKGNKLIIGYLKVSKELSAFANKSIKTPSVAITDKKVNANKIVTPKDKPSGGEPVLENRPAVEIKEIKKDTPPAKIEEVKTPAATSPSTINFNGGAFKNLYTEQMKGKTENNQTGLSGIFKSTSGWQDGKYYCFNNDAPEGTIIKITNPTSGKSIYAKVLDLIPEIKQNNGLMLQLSNAAAEELEVKEAKFNCTITYYK